jgi:hypothetical protein
MDTTLLRLYIRTRILLYGEPTLLLRSTEMLHLFYDRQGVGPEILLHPPLAAGIVKRPLGSSKENFATHSSRDSR